MAGLRDLLLLLLVCVKGVSWQFDGAHGNLERVSILEVI